jgi:hypothetical protein
MPKKQPKPDAISTIVALVNAATDSEPVLRGEDLIGDPETRRKFLEAKRKAAKKTKAKPLASRS